MSPKSKNIPENKLKSKPKPKKTKKNNDSDISSDSDMSISELDGGRKEEYDDIDDFSDSDAVTTEDDGNDDDDDDDDDIDEDLEQEEKDTLFKDEDIRDYDDTCVYRHIPKHHNIIDDDDDIIEDHFNDEDTTNKIIVSKEDMITSTKLTKFERVCAIGTRAQQLILGAPSILADEEIKNLNSKQIAELELKHKKMPYIVERELPNGNIEKIDINFLEIVN